MHLYGSFTPKAGGIYEQAGIRVSTKADNDSHSVRRSHEEAPFVRTAVGTSGQTAEDTTTIKDARMQSVESSGMEASAKRALSAKAEAKMWVFLRSQTARRSRHPERLTRLQRGLRRCNLTHYGRRTNDRPYVK